MGLVCLDRVIFDGTLSSINHLIAVFKESNMVSILSNVKFLKVSSNNDSRSLWIPSMSAFVQRNNYVSLCTGHVAQQYDVMVDVTHRWHWLTALLEGRVGCEYQIQGVFLSRWEVHQLFHGFRCLCRCRVCLVCALWILAWLDRLAWPVNVWKIAVLSHQENVLFVFVSEPDYFFRVVFEHCVDLAFILVVCSRLSVSSSSFLQS